MKIAYIMRGISGSGKSTIAKKLAGESGVIHSTDDLFITDGVYTFNPSQLHKKHAENFTNFCKSIDTGTEIVICDNTNTMHWEYEHYIEAAKKRGYLVAIVAISHPTAEEAFHRNTHDVPRCTIESMLARWEK